MGRYKSLHKMTVGKDGFIGCYEDKQGRLRPITQSFGRKSPTQGSSSSFAELTKRGVFSTKRRTTVEGKMKFDVAWLNQYSLKDLKSREKQFTQMTSRDAYNQAIKIKVMDSWEFAQWWEWRSKIEPIPRDPYIAFRTDQELFARTEGLDYWKGRVNRSDIDIDYPRKREREIPRKHRKKKGKRIRREPTPQRGIKLSPQDQQEKEYYQKFADELCEHYKVPRVELVYHPRTSSSKSHYASRWSSKSVNGERRYYAYGNGVVHLGGAGRHSMVLSTLSHELGHHVDYRSKFQERGFLTSEEAGGVRRTPKQRLADEKRAWKIAQPYITGMKGEPVARWGKRFALETYRRKKEVVLIGQGDMKLIFGEKKEGID